MYTQIMLGVIFVKCCSKCGTQINDNAEYCYNCGERVEVSFSVQPVKEVYENYGNIKERSIVMAIVLTILTCGLYSIYWMAKINDESLEITEEGGPSGAMVVLLTLVTCGLYGYFWAYKMGECVDKMKGNEKGTMGVIYVILSVCSLSIVSYALSQDAINNKVK